MFFSLGEHKGSSEMNCLFCCILSFPLKSLMPKIAIFDLITLKFPKDEYKETTRGNGVSCCVVLC